MTLDNILVWMIGPGTALGLLMFFRRFGLRYPGWLVAHAVVLAALGGAYVLAPQMAGRIAAAAWLPLIAVPLALNRWLPALVMHGRYETARIVARIVAVLHPADGLRDYPTCVAILVDVQRGDLAAARRRHAELHDSHLSHFTTLHLLRAEGRWSEIVAWMESLGDPLEALPEEFAVQYERALGEVGRIEEMLAFHEARRVRHGGGPSGPSSQLAMAGLTGRLPLIEKLFAGPFRRYPAALRDYWTAIARLAAGEQAEATATLERLVLDGPPDVRTAAQRRLLHPNARVDVDRLSPAARSALQRFEEEAGLELRYRTLGHGNGGGLWVTWGIAAVNLAVFALEIPGGPENLDNLVRLGALVVPPSLVPDSWWRVIAAGFLHFGVLHVTLNVCGMLVLGSYVERVWGRWRLLLAYLVATVGANALALLLVHASPENPVVMLGASGGVMGILGAALAFALLAWRRLRVDVLRRQIGIFLVVLLFQVIFDARTPQVSGTLHLLGLGCGFATALVMGLFDADRPRITSSSRSAGSSERGRRPFR